MSKHAPALFGSFSLLDERADLLLELEAYAKEEQREEREREARERTASRRRSLRGRG